jgi:hypothetical protein
MRADWRERVMSMGRKRCGHRNGNDGVDLGLRMGRDRSGSRIGGNQESIGNGEVEQVASCNDIMLKYFSCDIKKDYLLDFQN